MAQDSRKFAALLKQLRKTRGLSLRQLQSHTGVSNSYLSQIESGQVGPPSAKVIQKLADALECPYGDLMTAAGYAEPIIPGAAHLHLGDRTLPLEDLTTEEKVALVDFVRLLRARRSG